MLVQVQVLGQVQMQVQVLVQVACRYLDKTKMSDWEIVLGCAATALRESGGSFVPFNCLNLVDYQMF